MGYTRYWNRTDKPFTEDFIKDVMTIIGRCAVVGIKICGGLGAGNPKVTNTTICINGDKSKGLEHESFYLGKDPQPFDFCKTARKPYDYAVREILRVAETYGIVKELSDDGENEEIISDDDFCRMYL